MRFPSRQLDAGLPGGSSTDSYSVDATDDAASRTIAGRFRRRWPAIAAVLGLALLAVVLVIGWSVRDSMRRLNRQTLRSMLAANVGALQMWLAETRSDALRLAGGNGVDAAARQLLDDSTDRDHWTFSEVRGLEPYRALAGSLKVDPSYLGWVLLDSRGRVVASSIDLLVGETLAIPPDAWRRLAAQGTTVCRPFRSPIALTDEGPLSLARAPVMCAMAPVVRGARTVGSLALLLDPLGRFTQLLSVAPARGGGQTYAFDRLGVLLSQSRYEQQLRAAGLLAADPLVSSPLNVSVRDPGVNLTTGNVASLPRDQQPLTWMADQATRGGTGDDVIGYNDYRGVPVIGSWQWLPEYDIGVATEMEVAQAYQPVHLLERSLLGMLSLIAASAIGLMIVASVDRRLGKRRRRADHAARRLGQYELSEVIGKGGMGTVYRGHHKLLRRDVAVKVLEGDDVDAQAVSRFEREVRMTARLRHPCTIDIYDYGRTGQSTFFYVMEHVEGITLEELVQRFGAQPAPRVIYLMLQICGSLAEAHQLGLIHRDIKPSNILLTARAGLYDIIKVLDFGLVKEVDGETSELTQSQGITGTPMYMSPEAVRDASSVTATSDLYSLGAVGYTLLTGLPLFDGESTVEVCLKQLDEQPLRPSERLGRELPEDLQNVLMSCLRKDPQDRPLSVEELESAFRVCRDAGRWGVADALHWWEVVYQQTGGRDPQLAAECDAAAFRPEADPAAEQETSTGEELRSEGG